MLATLGGTLALLLGLIVLLLPLLAAELSRPRDSAWGAVVLLLGLVLVTSADRLTGSPMLAVLCGGLLIGRLGSEVGLARWHQLSPEERQLLGSTERWRSSFTQLGASGAGLLQNLRSRATGLGAWLGERRRAAPSGKRWVRPEKVAPETPPASSATTSGSDTEPKIVRDFCEIDDLLAAAGEAASPADPGNRGEAG